MKVKALRNFAGPKHMVFTGETINVPDEVAEEYIAHGLVILIDNKPDKTADKTEVPTFKNMITKKKK